ncbi:MAG: hypothetical protein M3083_25610, partial [Actinomycetota bacterium]|nr:hypothetical protein [Actinomycetota bacterium]
MPNPAVLVGISCNGWPGIAMMLHATRAVPCRAPGRSRRLRRAHSSAQVALLDLQPNSSRRWPATQGVVDFGTIEAAWLREVAKDWARSTRPNLQRLREALRACRAASQALVAAGRRDPASLGAGDFALVVQAISTQRRPDGRPYSANHRNLLLDMLHQVIDRGRANTLMAQAPDPFGRGRPQRVSEDPNEDQLGKALPESVIRQLDNHLDLLGP